MGLRLRTKIDRIAIGMALSKKEFNQYIPWLCALAMAKKGIYTKGKNGWSHGACIHMDGKNGMVRISIEKIYGSRFLKYEFKPRTMTNQAFLELDIATAELGNASYRSCLVKGVVSYVEVAADFVGRHTSEILIFQPYIRATTDGSKKILSTYYLGSRSSARTTVAYNRAEHPGASGHEKAWSQLMRVEVRLRRPKIVPICLGTLKNPFTSIHVCEFETLKAKLGDDPKAIDFLYACRMAGSPQAFSIFPEFRKPMMKLAAASHAAWWRPSGLMDTWEATVSQQIGMDVLACSPA